MFFNGVIVVNNYGRINIENIYFCGDCVILLNKLINENGYIFLVIIVCKFVKVVVDDILGIKNEFVGYI